MNDFPRLATLQPRLHGKQAKFQRLLVVSNRVGGDQAKFAWMLARTPDQAGKGIDSSGIACNHGLEKMGNSPSLVVEYDSE